jgi:hypothetical protein
VLDDQFFSVLNSNGRKRPGVVITGTVTSASSFTAGAGKEYIAVGCSTGVFIAPKGDLSISHIQFYPMRAHQRLNRIPQSPLGSEPDEYSCIAIGRQIHSTVRFIDLRVVPGSCGPSPNRSRSAKSLGSLDGDDCRLRCDVLQDEESRRSPHGCDNFWRLSRAASDLSVPF